MILILVWIILILASQSFSRNKYITLVMCSGDVYLKKSFTNRWEKCLKIGLQLNYDDSLKLIENSQVKLRIAGNLIIVKQKLKFKVQDLLDNHFRHFDGITNLRISAFIGALLKKFKNNEFVEKYLNGGFR